MDKKSLSTRFLRLVNGFISVVISLLLGLLVLDLIDVTHFTEAAGRVKDLLIRPRIVVGICVFLVLFLNLYHLVACLGANPYETHLRSEMKDGEVSVAVHAVENTLERAVEALSDISEANVDVMKKSGDPEDAIHIRTTLTTHEKTKFKNVVKHVQSILQQRWNEIIEMDETPYFEIVLGDVSEETAESVTTQGNPSDQTQNDEDPYLSDTFSGPKYPVDEDEENK